MGEGREARIVRWWRKRTAKPVQVRPDYREFVADRMKSWGHNAFWWPKDSRTSMCMFGSRPQVGDVVVANQKHHVVEEVRTPSNPGDQHFLTLRPLDEPPVESEREPSWTDGLV